MLPRKPALPSVGSHDLRCRGLHVVLLSWTVVSRECIHAAARCVKIHRTQMSRRKAPLSDEAPCRAGAGHAGGSPRAAVELHGTLGLSRTSIGAIADTPACAARPSTGTSGRERHSSPPAPRTGGRPTPCPTCSWRAIETPTSACAARYWRSTPTTADPAHAGNVHRDEAHADRQRSCRGASSTTSPPHARHSWPAARSRSHPRAVHAATGTPWPSPPGGRSRSNRAWTTTGRRADVPPRRRGRLEAQPSSRSSSGAPPARAPPSRRPVGAAGAARARRPGPASSTTRAPHERSRRSASAA